MCEEKKATGFALQMIQHQSCQMASSTALPLPAKPKQWWNNTISNSMMTFTPEQNAKYDKNKCHFGAFFPEESMQTFQVHWIKYHGPCEKYCLRNNDPAASPLQLRSMTVWQQLSATFARGSSLVQRWSDTRQQHLSFRTHSNNSRTRIKTRLSRRLIFIALDWYEWAHIHYETSSRSQKDFIPFSPTLSVSFREVWEDLCTLQRCFCQPERALFTPERGAGAGAREVDLSSSYSNSTFLPYFHLSGKPDFLTLRRVCPRVETPRYSSNYTSKLHFFPLQFLSVSCVLMMANKRVLESHEVLLKITSHCFEQRANRCPYCPFISNTAILSELVLKNLCFGIVHKLLIFYYLHFYYLYLLQILMVAACLYFSPVLFQNVIFSSIQNIA